MKTFEFSANIINKIIDEIKDANEFIRIAIFRLHNQGVFDVLNDKLGVGVEVEIFTLPYDSINENIRAEVTELFQNLEINGATLHFCKWNVGDPERTATAVGGWYSFHGKFIVTDKSAIALSANFTQDQELDALIIFKNEMDKIEEYNTKFNKLIELFILESSGYEGIIRQRITDTDLPEISSVFELPPVIETETHTNHWILHYPSSLCPVDVPIEDKLYLSPFDCRGRNFIMSLISEASEFVYISTESFTDPDFSKFLMKTRLKGIDIRILTGATSMDFTDRMQKMFRELLAHDIRIRTIEKDIHAKLIITDKHLAVTSVNLNKMNLGFKKTNRYWRENTEFISVCRDTKILLLAKNQYLSVFDDGIDIETALAEKIENLAGGMFTPMFDLRSSKEVKKLFARLVIRKELRVKKFVRDIGKTTAKLMQHFNKKTVGTNEFLLSLILYYLSERKHDFDQLTEKLGILDAEINLDALFSLLLDNNFIEKVDDYYKIKIDKLF
jgi:phosphatidylserine/phosphatidylglycerophosphate/cardiolipin synthase-like enzyme